MERRASSPVKRVKVSQGSAGLGRLEHFQGTVSHSRERVGHGFSRAASDSQKCGL